MTRTSEEPVKPSAGSPSKGRQLAGGAAAVMLIQGGGALLRYFNQVLFARWLGVEVFGAFNVAIVLSQGLAVVAAVGLSMGVLRYAPAYLERSDLARLHGLLRFADMVPALMGSALGLITALILRGLGMPWGYALVTGVLIPLTAVAQVEGEAVRATRRVALAYVPQFIVRPILTVGAGLLLFRYGRDSTFATASAVVAALGVAVWQYASVRQAYGPKVFSAAPVAENAEWVRTGIPLMVSSVVTYIVNQADILIVGGLLGFRDAGYYAAAQRTATVVGFILFASNAVVAPALSRMFAAGDIQGMRRMVTQVTRWTFVAAVLSGVVVAGIAPFLLDWFGEGFQQAAGVLILLVGARIVSAAAGPVGYILGLTGHERIAARLQTIIGLGGVAAMAILAMRYGLMGAAIGSALSLAGVNVALAVVVWRHYRIAPLGMGARPPREA